MVMGHCLRNFELMKMRTAGSCPPRCPAVVPLANDVVYERGDVAV